MSDPVVFKCEDSLWQMLAEEGVTGIPAKPFDMRRYDTTDDRIYRLLWMTWAGEEAGEPDKHFEQAPHLARPKTFYKPDVEAVSFVNKETGQKLTRRYLGMEFSKWAPGWCFLVLGERVEAPEDAS